jgi:hypothetical protein
MSNKTWSVSSAGALGEKLGVPLNDEAALEYLKWLERGRKWFVIHKVSARIEIGRAAYKIKNIVGDEHFKKAVEQNWLPEGTPYKKYERRIQEWIQMFRFSTRKGRKLKRNIHTDSYIKIMQFVERLPEKSKNRTIKEINITSLFRGVDIGATQDLRAVLKEAKAEISNSNDIGARNAYLNQQIRDSVKTTLRSHATLLKSSKELWLLLKNNDVGLFTDPSVKAIDRLHLTLKADRANMKRTLKNLRIRSGSVVKNVSTNRTSFRPISLKIEQTNSHTGVKNEAK